MEATERENLEAVLRGHKERFEPIVRQYQASAYSAALSLVGQPQDALDLCQEAFLRAYRALHTFDLTLPFFPWFYRILRNLCLSHLKRRQRRPLRLPSRSTEGEEEEIELAAATPCPGEILEQSEAIEHFRTAFARLGTRDREILSLRHFQELSYQQIARALEIPIGTVMSRLFYARRKLREIMEADSA